MLHVKIVSSLAKNLEFDVDLLAKEFVKLDVIFCGFDSEMTVVSAMQNALLGDEELVVPSIVQLCVKKTTTTPHYSFAIPGIVDQYTCFIFPIKALMLEGRTIPTSLIQLLRNERIVKAAVGIRNDLNMLGRSLGFQIGAPQEIQNLAMMAGATDLGLGALAQKFTSLTKGQSAGGNYDGQLSSDQIYYASLDALISHLIVERILGNNLILERESLEIPLSESELKNMWYFLKNSTTLLVSVGDITTDKLRNQFYNSYSDWRSRSEYTRSASDNAVNRFIDWSLDTKRLMKTEGGYRSPSIVFTAPTIISARTKTRVDPNDYLVFLSTSKAILKQSIDKKGVTQVAAINLIKSRLDFPGVESEKTRLIQNVLDDLVRSNDLIIDVKTRRYY